MKQLYTLLLAALLYPILAPAQTDFSVFDAPVRIADEIIPATSPNGELCLYTYRSGTAYFSTVSATGQHIATVEHPGAFKTPPEIAAVLSLPDQFVFYRRERLGDVELLQPIAVDKTTGALKVLSEMKPVLDPQSTFLQAFTSGGKSYVLYFSKKTSNLQVYVFSDAQEHEVKRFPLSLPKMEKRLFFGGVPVFMDEQVPSQAAIASRHKKIYLRGDKMLLILDGFGGTPLDRRNLTTDILELDLSTQRASFSQLPTVRQIRAIDMNSLLHQNTLFRYQMTTSFLNLSAYDLHTQLLQKEYAFKLNDPVTIKATPVIRNGGRNKFPNDTATVETTKMVLRKMTEGNAFVLVDEIAPNTLQLSLGAYQTGPGSTATLPIGTPLVSAFGPAALPAVLALAAIRLNASYNPTIITTHFKTSLAKNTLEQTSHALSARLWEEADRYSELLEEQEKALGGVAVYPYQPGQLHYVVLDRATKKYQIVTLTQLQNGMNPSQP